MNTKGIKFLAVLAVLAMAFAVFAVINTDGQENDAAGGVAKIGTTEYATLTAAFEAVKTGETIELISNISDYDEKITVSGKSVTLDLKGYTITTKDSIDVTSESVVLFSILSGASLTIDASTDGKIVQLTKSIGDKGKGNNVGVFSNAGTLTINDGTYKTKGYELINTTGTTVINKGTFESNYVYGTDGNNTMDSKCLFVVSGSNASFTMVAGTANSYTSGNGDDGMYGVYGPSGGKIILGKNDGTGPSFTSFFAPIGFNNTTAPTDLTVYGGTYVTKTAYAEKFGTVIYLSASGVAKISGGTFTNENGPYSISVPYKKTVLDVKITGGTFNGSVYKGTGEGTGEGSDHKNNTFSVSGATFSDMSILNMTMAADGKMEFGLNSNCAVTSEVTIPAKAVVTNLSGKTLTNSSTITINGTLTNEGTIDNTSGTINLGTHELQNLKGVSGKVTASTSGISGYQGSTLTWNVNSSDVTLSSEAAGSGKTPVVSYKSTWNSTNSGFDLEIAAGKVTTTAALWPTQLLTVDSGAELIIGGAVDFNTKDKIVNNGTITIDKGKSLTSHVEISGSGTLAIKGTYISGKFAGENQATTCNVDIYEGAMWTGANGEKYVKAGEETTFVINIDAAPGSGDAEKVLSFKQVMKSGNASIDSVTYAVYEPITINNTAWIDNSYTDNVTIKDGGSIALPTGTTVIGKEDTVELESGAAIVGGAGKNLQVAGILKYADVSQAYGYADVKSSTEGSIIIPGSGGSSDEKVVVDNDVGTKIDESTFEKDKNKDAAVIVTNTAVTTATVPANKAVVINAALTDATLTVKEENSEIALNLGETGSSFTVDTGAGKIKATGLKGSFTFTKGSIVVDAKDWTGGSMELENGDVVKLKGKITGTTAAFTLKSGATSATVIVLADDTLTIESGKTLTVADGITMKVEGTVIGDGTTGTGTLTINGVLDVLSGGKILPADEGTTLTVTGSGDFFAYSGSDINSATIVNADVAKWSGKDADGGEWTVSTATAKHTLVLNNYNGTYNFGAFSNDIETIKAEGDSKISYAFTDKYADVAAGFNLFGVTTADAGVKAITSDTSGSLEIDVDISKVPTGKLFKVGTFTVINGNYVDINGADLKIVVNGGNSAWTATDTKGMNVVGLAATGINVTYTINTYNADVEIDVLSAYEAAGVIGIKATGAGTVTFDNAVVLSVKSAGTAMNTAGAIKISNSPLVGFVGKKAGINDTTAQALTIQSSALVGFEGDSKIGALIVNGPAVVAFNGDNIVASVSETNKAVLGFEGFVEITGETTLTQESSLALQDAVLGAVTNGGLLKVNGDVALLGAFENKATGAVTNAGIIGIYEKFENKGIITNTGSINVLNKVATDLDSHDEIAIGGIPTDEGKATVSAIHIEDVYMNGDGSVAVKATLSFSNKDGVIADAKLDTEVKTFIGTLTLTSQDKAYYTLTLTNGTATVTFVYKELTTGAGDEIGKSYTISAGGSIKTNDATPVVYYLENNKDKSAVSTDEVKGLMAVATNAAFELASGTVSSEGKFVVFKSADNAKFIQKDSTFAGNIDIYLTAVTINGNVEGAITSNATGAVTIGAEAKVDGSITAKGAVTVAADGTTKKGVVNGPITADGNVTVNGTVKGDITTKGDVTVAGKLTGDITVNANDKKLNVTGEVVGKLTYNSKYKATPTATEPTTYTNVMEIDGKATFAINLAAGADATASTAVKPGVFTLGALVAPATTAKVDLKLTEGKLFVPTGVTVPVRYAITIETGTIIEVDKSAALNVQSAALKVSDGATSNFETGSAAPVNYGKVTYIMSFATADGYKYFSDVAYALTNCDEGSDLTVGSNADISSNVSIKKGVTVTILTGVTLDFKTFGLEMKEEASIVLKGTGNIKFGETGEKTPAGKDWEFYKISGTFVYDDNVILMDGVRFNNAANAISGIAETATSASKFNVYFDYFQGGIAVYSGEAVGTIKLDQKEYSLTEADSKAVPQVKDMFAGSFGIAEGAIFSATSIIDVGAAGVYDADLKDIKYTKKASVVDVDGTLKLSNDTTVYGIYVGEGQIILADGKFVKITTSTEVGPAADLHYYGANFSGKIVNAADDVSGYDFASVMAAPGVGNDVIITSVAKTTSVPAFVKLSGKMLFGEIDAVNETTVAKLDGLYIMADASVSAVTTEIVGASTSEGKLATVLIKMAPTTGFAALTYDTTYMVGLSTVYTAFENIDFDVVTDVTIEKDRALSQLGVEPGKKLDLSGKDVTINVAEGKVLIIDRIMIIGTPATAIGDEGSALSGKFVIDGTNYMVIYADVDVTDAEFEGVYSVPDPDVKLDAVYSTLSIDDVLYATIVAAEMYKVGDNVVAGVKLVEADKKIVPEIIGYNFTKWANYDEDVNSYVGETNAYADAKAVLVTIVVKYVAGVDYYMNGLLFNVYDIPTDVSYGSYFTAKISDTTKYQGNPLINGEKTVCVTEDVELVASGVTPIPEPPQPEPEPVVGDSGLSLTDILLIVLVILIAIMVVILVLRLNRS